MSCWRRSRSTDAVEERVERATEPDPGVSLIVAARGKIEHDADIAEQRYGLGVGERDHDIVAFLGDFEVPACDYVDVVDRRTAIERLPHFPDGSLAVRLGYADDRLPDLEVFDVGGGDLQSPYSDQNNDDAQHHHSNQGNASLALHESPFT